MRTGFFLFWFLPLISLIFSFSSCEEDAPVISAIDPRIGQLGEVLTITGENFGDEQAESYVTIAGIPPTTSSYIEWKQDRIQVKVPEFGGSGLVYVFVKGKKSNPELFANRADIPMQVEEDNAGIGPRIKAIEPASGTVGSLITIKGRGFGASRDGSGVWFSWKAENSPATPAEVRQNEAVEASETEFGYESWNDREIQVRIPDGTVSGTVEARTPRGSSLPVSFDITGKPGTKTFKDKRSYTIRYSVDIHVQEASGHNSLYLWIPRPITSSSQRNIQILERSHDAFIENYRGSSLFQLVDLAPQSTAGIFFSCLIDVYTVETGLRTAQIKQNRNSPIHTAYTLSTSLIPSDNEKIKLLAASIVGKEQNPHLKAQLIYRWLISKAGMQAATVNRTVVECIEEKRCDSYTAALIFCSLARAAGVPALPVAGVLVNHSLSASKHYWAEFWIDGFGWVPVDPALGAGLAPAAFNLKENHAAYYFGNIDNQRIAFSKGEIRVSRMDPRGRVSVRNRDYALQDLWEEASGGLDSYSSLWSDIIITGVYTQ
ncbi:MAG: IPT/TIG domain-containing protein [Treponema sp.]|jgi:transglutaminase-like putative cysteine protease|nr:IPT/TIG domain-containing protein [Treponema sp.]